MKPSDNLFNLIKSLTKSEKRYFKVIASKKKEEGSNYLQLFNAIDKQEVYCEEQIVQRFSKSTFIKHLPSEKNYLYFAILKSLILFHEGNHEFIELDEIRHFAAVLYSKGLYDQCNKMLTKARKSAVSSELFPELLSIAKLQLELLPMIAMDGENLQNGFEAILNDEKLAYEKLHNIHQYHQLYAKFLHLIRAKGELIRNESELELFKGIMNNPLLMDEDKAMSYKSKEMYFFITTTYFFISGNLEKAYEQGIRNLNFLADNLGKLTSVAIYSARISNQCEACLRMKKYDEFEKLLELLKNIETNSVLEKSKNFYRYHDLLLRYLIVKGDFEEATQLTQSIEEGIKQYEENIHMSRVINMYYYIAYAHFGKGDFRTSLRWISRIISSKTDLRSDILCFSRLLNLILHIELDNQLQLDYVFKATYSYFIKRERLYKLEDYFLKFLKKNITPFNSKTRRESFLLFKEELLMLLNDPYEHRALEYFDFISWLESKIENRSFMEIIKEKHD